MKPSMVRQSVTIRDVARKAGVSVAAASYALNDLGRISIETKAKVRSAAEELGYCPSIAAQALKGTRGNLIVILTDGFAGPWYGEILEGLQPSLKESGYAVSAMTIQEESLALCMKLARAGLLCGLVILNPSLGRTPIMQSLVDFVPTAIFDADERLRGAQRFVIDNRRGIVELMDHLWARGYRDYLWVDGDSANAWDARERGSALEEYLTARACPSGALRRVDGKFRTDVAYRAVSEALAAGPPPRAIVAANDESAIGAMKSVRERGLDVPGDVAIAGFDGIDISAWTEPALTTVRYDRRALGKSMADWVADSLRVGAGDLGVTIVPVNLVVRGST